MYDMKPQMTLRTRLVALVIAAVVPLFGLSVVKAVLETDAAVAQATQSLELAASLAAAGQEQLTDSAKQILAAIANVPGLSEMPVADCQRYFNTLNDQLPIYANLGIIAADGYVRCHGLELDARPYVGDRAYFQAALKSRAFVTDGVVIGRATKKPVVNFSAPATHGPGTVTTVAFVAMDLVELSKAMSRVLLPGDSRMVIMDRQGLVMATKPENLELVGKLVASPTLQKAIKADEKGVFEGSDAEGVERIYAFMPSVRSGNAPFFVAVSSTRDEVLAPAKKLMALEFALLALTAFLGCWVAWVLASRAIVRPAAKILDAAGQLESGRLDVRIPISDGQTGNEFTRIAKGFNRMAAALEQREQELAMELSNSEQDREALGQLQQDQARSNVHLLEVQRKLLDAQRLGRIGHWEMDVQTGQLMWSDELHALFGLVPGEFDGSHDTFIKMLHPQDRVRYERVRAQALLGDGEFEIEYRIVTPDGNVRWMHQRGKSHTGNLDQPNYRAGVVQDITARKESELALVHSTDLLRRSGEMAKVGGWELIVDGMQWICSDQMLLIHDLLPDAQFTLEDASNAYLPEARQVFVAAIQKALDFGSPWDLELPMTTAKGRSIWVRSQGQAVLADGQVVRLQGALQDITVQHEASEHLRLLETSVSRLNDIVLITEAEPFDEPGPRIVFVNDAFERRTGFTREEVLGRSPRFLQGPKTQRAELDRIGLALRSWQPVRAELINYKKNGEEFWLELDIVPIADATGWFTHWVSVERDITQRKMAEQALVESEQRYAALFESAPVPLWVYDDANYKFLAVNRCAVQTYGYSVDEFMSKTLFDISSAASHDEPQRRMTDPLEVGKEFRVHRRKDGSLLAVDVMSRPIQYAGSPACLVVALDVTAQRKAETELSDHLFTLQRAADAAQAITSQQNLQGMMQEFADQARGVIGVHQAVVSLTLGDGGIQSINSLSLSDKYAKYRHLLEPIDGSGIYQLPCETSRTMRLTQAELEAHPRWRGFGDYASKHPPMRGWLAVPLTGRNGKNIGLLQLSDKFEGEFTLQDEYIVSELAQLASIAIENTKLLEEINQLNTGLEQKVAERTAALARQEALFRALADEAPQVVWTADPEGMLTYLNRAWFDLAGGVLEDWTGNRWLKAIHPDDLPDAVARWKKAIANQSKYVGERRLRAKDGSYHTMSYRASPVLDDHGKVSFWVGIDADITEIKTIEAALRLSNQELEAFSYSVSHDLRSPLNSIDGFSRLLAKQLSTSAGEKERHYMSRIQAGAAQMGRLIEDLLSLAQVSRIQLHHDLVDLSALSAAILDEYQGRHPERHVDILVEDGLHAQGDANLIRVVLENLIGNAWKFTSKTAHASIKVGHYVDAAGITVFFVRDNGAGFDMAYADKLFTAFQRLHGATEFPGTGIGLATVSRVIQRHSGLLWTEAALGSGATFFFTLPKIASAL